MTRKITVQITVEDMGRISLALDNGPALYANSPEWAKLQKKWDRMYRGLHQALETGVVGLEVS